MANKTPVWYDGGFGVYTGDDTIHHNYTENTGNVLTIERGGGGNEVLQVLNKGELKVKSVAGAASAALTVDALTAQAALTLNDDQNSDHLITIRKVASGASWLTDFLVRDPGDASNDSVALRITHDIQDSTPPQDAYLLSIGYTGDDPFPYLEMFRFKQSGEFFMVGGSGADILWATGGGGDIGESVGTYSPANIYATTLVSGGGSTISTQLVEIGPIAANTKVITALQTGTNDPGIRYNSSTSTWQASNNGTDWTNFYLGAGNNLDEAYNAFGGVGNVAVDAGTLTWTLTSPYDFIIADATNTYFQADSSTGQLALSTNAASANVSIDARGTTSQINMTSTSNMSVDAGGGISLDAAGVSNFTTSSSNLNLSCTSGTMNQDMLTWDVNSNRAVSIKSGTGAGNYGFIIENQGALTSYVRTSYAGDLQIYADTTSGQADLTLASGGNTTISCGRALNIHVDTVGNTYDLSLTVPDSATQEILFRAHGSAQIPFNSASPDNDLVGFTATSVIGALNEVKDGAVTTWDDLYALDKALTIDGDPLVFTQTSAAYGFQITRNEAITTSPMVGISCTNAAEDNAALEVTTYATAAPALTSLMGSVPTGTVSVTAGGFVATGALGASADVSMFGTTIYADASDNASAQYRGFYAVGDATGSAKKYGFSADATWDYGLHSLAPGLISLAGFTSGTAGFTVDTTSGGTSSDVYGYRSDMTAVVGDTGTYYGYIALLGGTTSNLADSYGFAADDSWDYGFYSASMATVVNAAITSAFDAYSATIGSGGMGSTNLTGVNIALSSDAADTGVHAAFRAQQNGTTTNLTGNFGYYADADWTYGLYSESPGSIVLTSFTSGTAGFTVDTTSGGTSGSVYGYRSDMTAVAGDTGNYYGYIALLGGTTSNLIASYGFSADADWTYGLYSLSPVYVSEAPASSPGGLVSIVESDFTSPLLVNGDYIFHFHAKPTGHASDPSGAFYWGFYAEGTATGSATKYGAYIDQNWDYSVYGLAKATFSDSFTTTGEAVHAEAGSATLGAAQVMSAVEAAVNGHASDDAGAFIYGVYANGTATGAAAKYGFYADTDWDQGVRSLSGGYFSESFTTDGWTLYSLAASSALGVAQTMRSVRAIVNGHAGDDVSSFIYGVHVDGTTTGGATKYGIYVDADWDYGLQVLTKSLINDTLSDTGNVLTVEALSGTLTSGEILTGVKADVEGHGSDSATAIIIGFLADGTITGAASKIGCYADANWDVGLYSLSGVYAHRSPTGSGSLESWATESVADPSGSLLSNDEVAAYKATLQDAAGDGGAYYYGLYITTTDAGSATKWGIHVDTTWPADQYVMRIRSGLWYAEEDFGTITTDLEHIDVNLSGLLDSSNEGRCINLDITPDSSQADGSRWIGVRANMANANANDTIGSIAFEANANWHYGLYVDNDLTVQQAINEGTIHVESISSSLVASGSYYGSSYYHTRHASDSGGTLYAYHADANTGAGLLAYIGFHAGTGCNTGVYSEATNNIFSRADDQSTITLPVVLVQNLDNDSSGGTAPALKVQNAYTALTGTALEIDHAYDGSDIQDTRRAIVLTNTSRNRRNVPSDMWQPLMTDNTTLDFYMQSSATGNAQHRWSTYSTEYYNKAIHMPLLIPHNSTLQNVSVMFYQTGANSGTEAERPRVEIWSQPYGRNYGTLLGSYGYAPYAASSGYLTCSVTALAEIVNNTDTFYYARFVTGDNTHTVIHVTGCQYDYDIVDLGAAPGF